MKALRESKFRGSPLPALGHDPQGKILGILGMGGIGRNVAVKARAFGMKIRYHNRNRLSPEDEDGAEYVSFETLLKESDVLSLNLPLNVCCLPPFFTICCRTMEKGKRQRKKKPPILLIKILRVLPATPSAHRNSA
jgi:phosphoglycerate dehydrogenase-like enzyme